MQRFRRSLLAWLGLTSAVAAAALLTAAPAAAQSDSGWTAGPQAILDNTYVGFIDQPGANSTVSTNGFTVSGWFVDRAAQGWAGADDVQVYLGTMDGGGRMLAKAQIGLSRPDVAATLGNPYWVNSGFSAQIPAGAVPAGPQTLTVYAHTGGKGWWSKQVNVTASATASTTTSSVPGGALPVIVIEAPKTNEKVLTNSDYEIRGYALDPNAARGQGVQSTGIRRVSIYLDAERENGGRFLGDAELAFGSTEAEQKFGAQFASAGYRLVFKPTQFKAGEGHEIYVYAESVVTGKEDWEVRGFDIADPKDEDDKD